MITLVILFCIYYIFTSILIYRKSRFFIIPYTLLFLYTVFTQIGYLAYPDKLSLYSFGQYYGEEIFLFYWLYVFLSFVFIFLIFLLIYNKEDNLLGLRIEVSRNSNYKFKFFYILFIVFYQLILLFFLLKNYHILSYYNQGVLKNNKLWFYLFSFDSLIIFSLFVKIISASNKVEKVYYIALIGISLFIFLITSIRSGQRIEFVMMMMSIFTFLLMYKKNSIKSTRNKIYLIVLLVIIILFSQSIRSLRGTEINLLDFITSYFDYKALFSFLKFENLVFQDWLVPSLTLITSMYKGIIFPFTVLESNLEVLIPLISHQSLGSILSRIIDPFGWAGYGYYILTEGYNFMGFMGFMYSSFIFVFGFRILELFFCNSKDELFNAYLYGILGFISLNVVRGQSAMLIKSIYFYILPSIILFILSTEKKVFLSKCKK